MVNNAEKAARQTSETTDSATESPARKDSILVIHGPNLNLLGKREPEHYGYLSLDEINQRLTEMAVAAQVNLSSFQSNHEGALIERIHAAIGEHVDFIIINPAGFTHSSVALRDALAGVDIPYIEVHLSNIHAREPFRAHSYFSDKAVGVVSGLGAYGYFAAFDYCLSQLRDN